MSTTLEEAINGAGFDLATEEDARWFLSRENEYWDLLERAKKLVDEIEEAEYEKAEQEYKERML